MTKSWNMKSAIEQIENCNFECEGGPLANNTAWIYLKSAAPAVVELVRAARKAQRSASCVGQISSDLLAALAPFADVKDQAE